jgi:hypothetical protein
MVHRFRGGESERVARLNECYKKTRIGINGLGRIGRLTFRAAWNGDWAADGVDVVLECGGKFRTPEQLTPFFERGVKKETFAAPSAVGSRILGRGRRYDRIGYGRVYGAGAPTRVERESQARKFRLEMPELNQERGVH